ncbi:P2Y purinoceptor 2 [Bombina bombina]|uniref:P2Y purinoceptor 2 n=1 Tax=Bombina bombina TaxID=8345 RepID=UPI00235B3081|nr:P2Y purinoceptor 2 [Bombina bombina]XP_053564694.1 P2Y purinoceptor 2 [Bombina bombina]
MREEKNFSYKCEFDEEFKFILLPTSYGIVFCLGLVLNVLALYIFIFKIRPWKVINVFMFNLAVSDLIYVLSLPLLIHYYSKENNWPFGMVLCKIVRFLFYTSLYCSIHFLLCISICRFLAVCYPIKFIIWCQIRYARIIAIGIWVVIIGIESPILYFVTTSNIDNDIVCHDTSNPDLFDQFIIYSTVNLVLLFCVPFIILLVCYGLMAYALWKPATATSQNSESKKKSIKMIIIVLLVFIICFLPFHVTRTMYYYFRKMDLDCFTLNAINIAYKVTRPLASANSFIDPILYFLVWRFRLRVTR